MDEKQIQQFSFWLKFMGILQMVYGAIYCLTIIGALIGVPMFLSGRGLLQASKDIINYQNYKAPETAEATFLNINKFFKINGIIFTIGLIGGLISSIFGGLAYMKMAKDFMGGPKNVTITKIDTESSEDSDNSSLNSYFNSSSSSNFSNSFNYSSSKSENGFNNSSQDFNQDDNTNYNNSSSSKGSNISLNTENFINGSSASSSRILVPSQSSSTQNSSRSTTSRNSVSSDSAVYDYRIN